VTTVVGLPERRYEAEREIEETVAHYVGLMNLEDWTLRVKFDYSCEDRANCDADDEYMEAWLTFNPAMMEKFEDDIEATVRHEMLHIVTWPVTHAVSFLAGEDKDRQELARLAYERTVTWLERMPIWTEIE
jgi:predicted SprT family Zn-dependent metalloprotease